MVILLSASLASLSPTSSGGLTMPLRSSLTDTCNNNFGMKQRDRAEIGEGKADAQGMGGRRT